MEISDLSKPRFIGKFGVTRSDGKTFPFATHEVSISPDERRIYAGVIASKGDDLNKNIKISPPNAEGLGPEAGGIYILDNSDLVDGKPDPQMRLVGTSQHGGWHSSGPGQHQGRTVSRRRRRNGSLSRFLARGFRISQTRSTRAWSANSGCR